MVKIFNNLNTIQPVRIRDRYGSYYTMFIESKRATEIESYQVTDDLLNKIKQGSILDLSNTLIPTTKPSGTSVVLDTVKVETINISQEVPDESEYTEEDEASHVEDNEGPTEELSSEVYICSICGNEYASKKGLEMHKSRSHK